MIRFRRTDVEEIYEISDAKVEGFIAIWPKSFGDDAVLISSETHAEFRLSLSLDDPQSSQKKAQQIVLEQRPRLGRIIHVLHDQPSWMVFCLPLIPSAGRFTKARAHIEQARGLPQIGGVVVGWSVSPPPGAIFACSASGVLKPLAKAVRWNRQDITEAFEADFGRIALNSGFMVTLQFDLRIEQEVKLIAIDGEEAFVLATSSWSPAPQDPTSLARWMFGFPMSSRSFIERLSDQIYPIMETLLRQRRDALRSVEAGVKSFGALAPEPVCSIIIPLYGRYDFIEHQMIEFARDPFIRNQTEIIYVIDDPRITDAVYDTCALYSELYGLPLRIVDGHINRGFSGANNLGASFARGRALLFLNSDVFPLKSGWLEKMLRALVQAENVGVVGARLLFHNGTLQHDGMSFEWNDALGAHLNQHPQAGMPPEATSKKATSRMAVTGACMLLRAETYQGVGGFEEEFLIGDFEDSDLCLKIRASGKKILCVEDVELVHLERQSFSGLGAASFSQLVVYYNLYKHEKRWGELIKAMLAGIQPGRKQ
ncbi:MAG: hypothetical protein DI629_07865 [Mesorhizobium amorphae]|nr:MAG: hypothetical protein DI629_07865 [Mesorhizobium amorphae]